MRCCRRVRLDGLRSDDHAIDMVLNQVAIQLVDRKLQRSKMRADAVQHEPLDIGCRHARDAAGLPLSVLQKRIGDGVAAVADGWDNHRPRIASAPLSSLPRAG